MIKILGFIIITKKEYNNLKMDEYTKYFADLVVKVYGFKGMYGYDKKSKDFIRKEIKKYFKK